jgi:NADH-quinone oxidoreductase subunit L
MTWPLLILALGSLGVGFWNAHAFFHSHRFDDWIAPAFGRALDLVHPREGTEALGTVLLVPGVLAFLVGGGLAYFIYVMQRGDPARRLADRFPRCHAFLLAKCRVDELYQVWVVETLDYLAEACVWIDRWVVDGILARLTAFVVSVAGPLLRFVQAGRVQVYAATLTAGVLGIGWFLAMPHAAGQPVSDHQRGEYRVQAAPGLGYRYRWDRDGDGEWDSEQFGGEGAIEFTLARNTHRTVQLQVKNAFGRTATEQFEFRRPALEVTGSTTRIPIEEGPDGKARVRQAPGAAPKVDLP